jgi:hypothetical protein
MLLFGEFETLGGCTRQGVVTLLGVWVPELVLYGVTSNDTPERAPSYEDFGDGDTAPV